MHDFIKTCNISTRQETGGIEKYINSGAQMKGKQSLWIKLRW